VLSWYNTQVSKVLEVKKLSKWYGQYHAVKEISFDLEQGEILGLLGPNGAGKTTTMQMLLGLTIPDSGSIHYFGKEFGSNQEYCLSRISFASAYSKLQGKLSIRQNLIVHAGLYNIHNPNQRIAELSELLGLSDFLDQVFWHLSSGQQTRAILAKALLPNPKLLLMDEPTASLDPEIVNKIIDLVRQLRSEQGISILFTSHNMEEVTRICDRVMFLRSGQIEAIDTPIGLTKTIKNTKLLLTFQGTQKTVTHYLATTHYAFDFIHKNVVQVNLPEDEIASVIFGFKKHDIFINHIEINKPTLEDVFLAMVQKQQESRQ
jgi:ABC-2 type transport system ATP-binding protein